VQARAATRRGDVTAARHQLPVLSAAAWPDLCTAGPGVQTRIELTRTHVVLGDLAGARTLIREIDELLRRRPGLGTLTGEAQPFPW